MYNAQDQLTELVRRLEEKNHIFSADPILITEKLQNESGNFLTKLRRRAARIDTDGKLAHLLATIDTRLNGVIWGLTVMWFVIGFVALVGVMQANVVNFFYVLASLLGFNTLILLVWLGWVLLSPRNKPSFFGSLFTPATLVRGKDAVTQTAIELYQHQLNHTGTKWYISRVSHQFWLASLLGMLVSLISLLLVKNYNFMWESTLLQDSTVVELVKVMSWLPNIVGFPTPTAQDIITAQMNTETTPQMVAFRWAMLLIGSLLMYGIAPRLVAWLFCLIKVRSSRMTLNIKQLYYQKIIDFWQRKVVDPDDSPAEQKPIAPTAQISLANKLAVLLEYPQANPHWYAKTVGMNAQNFGRVDDRDDLEKLITYLQTTPVQVLVGVSNLALPDRGTMRKLDSIANAAQGGMIVQLIDAHQDYLPDPSQIATIKARQLQWETALAERQIALVRES